jgi:hypothetical protein
MAIVLLIALVAALAGCGSSGSSTTATINPGGPRLPASPATKLTITYWPHGQGLDGEHVWTLTCRPAGGNHPSAAQACADLQTLRKPFAPPRRACPLAMIKGAPVADVTGRVAGTSVTSVVRPGCGTAWQRLHLVLTGR